MRLVIVGGSDAGISAALRARECAPEVQLTVLLADAYPNFSICGIPYHVCGEVPDWRSLAHRSLQELTTTSMTVLTDTHVLALDPGNRVLTVNPPGGTAHQRMPYDVLVVGTGAVPQLPPIGGLDLLGVREAVIIGAGYIGVEMAEALTHRGVHVTLLEAESRVLPRTLDPQLATVVAEEMRRNGVDVTCGTTVRAITAAEQGHLSVHTGSRVYETQMVLVVTGVRPDVTLLADAGARLGHHRPQTRPRSR